LNAVCNRPNVLFDKLTCAPIDPVRRPTISDTTISFALAPLLAVASLPLLGVLVLLGDGATLTYTCRGM